MNRRPPADASGPISLELARLINEHLDWTGARAMPLVEAIAQGLVPSDATARQGLLIRTGQDLNQDYLVTISKIDSRGQQDHG